MSFNEGLKLLVSDEQRLNLSKCLWPNILRLDSKALEDFPSDWVQGLDLLCHILFPVERVHHRIQLEEDAEVTAQVPHMRHDRQVVVFALKK